MTPRTASTPSRSPGFSLVEVMITLVILAALTGVLSSVLIATNRTHTTTATRAAVQSSTRQALMLMTTEVRHAGADPGVPAAGIVGVLSADSHTVRIRGDMNANGVIETAEPSEDVTYTYDAGTDVLQRNPGTGNVTALRNVTDMRFTYFDANGAPLTALPLNANDCALVRSIGITVTSQEGNTHPFTLATRITLRNQAQ